ncbi:diaminopimelate decarboxylase [Microbacterium azadirachtae]|uniref:Diaminopimelate decarboxylase n=1 Tax=Microbacterium azadirachtae TaxID=582680 RepID=A0A1I6FRN0_9MICO|nr:diaminopimelate decarboxylase [Microbacterium azadirachtae]SFR32556.1 diaminopimelate decarboxylase [Microbacterium azadirachtae]
MSHPILELLPEGTTVDADGTLRFGGCRVDDLAREFGTPAIVVDEGALRARAREYRTELTSRWPKARVVFASKSFPATAVQRVMVEEGLGLDVAGGGEILSALRAGVDPALLVLHGNAKSTEELQIAVDAGLGLVVVDNADDVDRLEHLVPVGRTQDVLVRIIPEVESSTHPHVQTGQVGSKFGLTIPAAKELIARIEASPKLSMRGVHAHVGSQIMDPSELAAAVAPLAELGTFPVYDLGGGLGARYTYDEHPATVAEYVEALVAAAREHLPADAELIIEPGRSMVNGSAMTLYSVTTVKRDARTFVAVDGGMGDNLEVALFAQRYEAALAGRLHEEATEDVVVVGRHCESGDVLIDPLQLPEVHVGDLLAVPATGAYTHTMANNYNGYRRPPVVFVQDGQARAVIRRETWDDLFDRDL